MASIWITISEETNERVLAALARLPEPAAGAEIRVDALHGETPDFAAMRRATKRPLLLTRRSGSGCCGRYDLAELRRAVDAGFDLVDVEYGPAFDAAPLHPFLDRVVLSWHDFQALPEVEPLLRSMLAVGAAKTKIAATPDSFAANRRLLQLLSPKAKNVTVIGMGAAGLYSRILAPFFGSELQFVVPDGAPAAAPGQLSFSRALDIYGTAALQRPVALFAVVGDPAAHSLSPKIHNTRFRARGLPAAYSILDTDDFGEVAAAFCAGEPFAPAGLSITAPYKESAFAFAQVSGATLRQNAAECHSVNTLVRVVDPGRRSADASMIPDGIEVVADNTDVRGFEAAFAPLVASEPVAVVGAGGTARAALVALRRRGIPALVFNRTLERGEAVAHDFAAQARPLDTLGAFEGQAVVNTTTAGSGIELPDSLFRPGRAFVDISYGDGKTAAADRARAAGMTLFDGLQFLEAQAEEQARLFAQVAESMAAEVKR